MVALAYSCILILKLAGYRPSRIAVAGVVAAAMALDPVWQTLFLGQINLILLALILTDIWLVSRGSSRLAVGIGVGIAAAIKLTPAIFIVFFLLARRTKAALVAAGTFIVCGLTGFSSRRAPRSFTGNTSSMTPNGSALPISATSRLTGRRSGSPKDRVISAPGGSSSRSRSPLSG